VTRVREGGGEGRELREAMSKTRTIKKENLNIK
jgi:hypothetical protein